jgi:hypothetical protein
MPLSLQTRSFVASIAHQHASTALNVFHASNNMLSSCISRYDGYTFIFGCTMICPAVSSLTCPEMC